MTVRTFGSSQKAGVPIFTRTNVKAAFGETGIMVTRGGVLVADLI